MTNKQKKEMKVYAGFVSVAVVVCLVVGAGIIKANNDTCEAGSTCYFYNGAQSSVDDMMGSAGNQLIENNLPYIRYNGGYNSDLPIETSDTLTVGGATILTGALSIGGTITNNGVVDSYDSKSATSATTTPCAFQSPTSTSTLAFGSAQFTLASSTEAVLLTIAKATTAYATTTQIGVDGTLAGGAQGTFIASTTSGTIGQTIFAPNEWLVFGVQGATSGSTIYEDLAGTCKAQFRTN